MGSTVNVTDDSFAAEVEQASGLTIVDFWATWCGPCHAIAPFLDQIAAERAGAVKVAKLDIDENMRTPARFNVRGAPTLLFFKGGRLVDQIRGAVPKAHIDAVIAQHV